MVSETFFSRGDSGIPLIQVAVSSGLSIVVVGGGLGSLLISLQVDFLLCASLSLGSWSLWDRGWTMAEGRL